MSTANASQTVAPGPIGHDATSLLWFVGALPPPLNGQSNCNRAMLNALSAQGAIVKLFDIGGTIKSKLRGAALAALTILMGGRRNDRAYLSIPGQAGVWLFVPFTLSLRLRRISHFVHHHSFRPINRGPTLGMRLLVAAGGRWQRHIVLSEAMQRAFAHLYLEDDLHRAIPLSNAYLFGPRILRNDRPTRPVTLGHMSVLTREKGVAYLLDLFSKLDARGHSWRLVIAGPCADPALAAELMRLVASFPDRVEYRGAVAGEDKERFFADIDLFVLPTTLVDEAEPLVMLEAYGRGVDVVANDTGCIGDRIRTPGHLLTRNPDQDCTLIERRILEAERNWAAIRRSCVGHARAIKVLADAEAAIIFPLLLGAPRQLPPASRL